MSNKTMPDQKLEKLNKLLSLVQEDTITPKEIEQFLVFVLETVKQSKGELDTISKETLKKIQESVSYIEENYNLKSIEIDQKSAKLVSKIEKQLEEVNKIISKVKLIKPKDGKDGNDGKDADEELIVEKVLSQIKPQEEESAEDIVEKINSLPLDEEEYKIDASHIKNLPVSKNVSGGVRALKNLNDVNIQNPTNNQVLSYNSTTGLWQNTTGGGGGGGTWGSITGTLSDQTDLQNALDDKIPFDTTGNLSITATGSINLDADTIVQRGGSTYGVSNNGGTTIQYFDTTNQSTDRTTTFPDRNGTPVYSVNEVDPSGTTGNVTVQQVPLRVKANSDLTKGMTVKSVGFNAGEQAIEIDVHDDLTVPCIGVLKADLLTGEFADIMVVIGKVSGIDTSAFAFNDILYPDGAGGFQTNPVITFGNFYQPLAYVVRSHATNGEIMVNVNRGHDNAYLVSYDGTQSNVGDALADLYDNKSNRTTTPIILDNTSSVSGASSGTAITKVYDSVLVPGGSYGTDFSIEIFLRSRKTNTNATYVAAYYINTSDTLTGATSIGSSTTDLSTRLTSGLYREIRVSGNTFYVYPTGAGNVTDIGNQTATTTTGTWTTANDMYIIRTLKANNASDSVEGVGSRVVLYPGV